MRKIVVAASAVVTGWSVSSHQGAVSTPCSLTSTNHTSWSVHGPSVRVRTSLWLRTTSGTAARRAVTGCSLGRAWPNFWTTNSVSTRANGTSPRATVSSRTSLPVRGRRTRWRRCLRRRDAQFLADRRPAGPAGAAPGGTGRDRLPAAARITYPNYIVLRMPAAAAV